MMKIVNQVDVRDKVVFLRVDWNVPLRSGEITDDTRIKATIPTIKYLISQRCRIIIGTHLGRPDGDIVPSLSTEILARRLSELMPVKIFCTDYVIESPTKQKVEKMKEGEVLVLGNLRWHAEEETNNPAFANILASYADVYVNDAFSVSHRAHASVEAITKFLPSCAGLLLEQEVEKLSILTQAPRKPFVLIIGGAKIKDKIGIIKKFSGIADKILIGGAIANTLKFFQGEDIGNSFFEPGSEKDALNILSELEEKIVLPADGIKKYLDDNKYSILDIGPKTVEEFNKVIAEAKTIFWNGNLGYTEEEQFENGTFQIARAINDNKFIKIAAGGDTTGFLKNHNLEHGFTFLSTGGGAALEFLAGEELPGLKVLSYYEDNKE